MNSRFILVLLAACFVSRAAFAVPLIRDAEIEHTLHVYGDPIFTASGLKASSVKIFIVNDEALNAYVAGGANMFIHTGLIEATQTPDMLIGVMAHEAGHIAGGHLAQGAEGLKNAQLGTILSYVLGGVAAVAGSNPDAAAAIITGGQNTVMRNYLAFTRTHEEQADQAALRSLDKLGISAEGMLKVLNLLQRNEREHPRSPDPYLLTHPLSGSRIEHVRNHIDTSKIPEGQYPHSYDILHKRMVAKLYGFIESPEQTLMKYPISDKSVAARLAHAIAYYKMPDLDRSIAEMDSLLKEAPEDPFFNELKGQILFENGKVVDALASYQKAARLLPTSPLILSDLGKVEMAQANPNLTSAITHLEKATSIDNSLSYAWRLLATAYGKQGNMGMSYLALAEESALGNDPQNTLKQVDNALSTLKPGSTGYQRAQDLKIVALDMKKKKDESDSPF